MKRRVLLVAASLLILATAVVAVIAQTSRPARPAWEYLEIELSATTSATPLLNRHGAEGWELVNVVSACQLISFNSTTGIANERCSYYAYFKRLK